MGDALCKENGFGSGGRCDILVEGEWRGRVVGCLGCGWAGEVLGGHPGRRTLELPGCQCLSQRLTLDPVGHGDAATIHVGHGRASG
jgi:hypothetical protein